MLNGVEKKEDKLFSFSFRTLVIHTKKNLIFHSQTIHLVPYVKKMSTTPTSLSATVDPHSALLAQRRSECEDYMRGLTVQYDPGENEFNFI